MNRKQKIIISVTGIFIVLLILVGLTYAYFLTRIQGNTNTKSITVTTKDLKITYGDGTNTVLTSDIPLIPSSDAIGVKDFTVTNEGDDTSYIVVIEDVKVLKGTTLTTFNSNDFRYTLTCTKSDGTSCDGVSEQTIFPINGGILVNNEIKESDVHTYKLTLWYIETNTDQSEDMSKTLEAKVNIKNINEFNPYSSNTLAYNIIENTKNKTNGTELLQIPKTKVAQEISKTDEKELSITNDDYGVSYYYRGNVIDNYVDFAGMCWRVVRIQGDGSIKLVLEDQDNTCADSDGNWNIPTTTGGTAKTGNFGYTQYAANTLTASDGTQNSSAKYLMNYLNGGTSSNASMVYAFKNFQTSLDAKLGTDKSLNDYLKAGDWCLNDKAYASNNNNTTPLTNTEILDKQIKEVTFYYDSYVRLNGKAIKEPTLKCNGTVLTKFTDDKDMYVGTLTADEIVYAGGKLYTSNQDYYLINDYQKTKSLWFWSLSPNYFSSYCDRAFGLNYSGDVNSRDVSFSYSFRPAVSLKSSVQITGGNGTKANAYTIPD